MRHADADARFWSPARARRWAALALLAVGGTAYVALADWSGGHVFLVNQSTSLPNWAFLVDRHRTPGRGEHVFFDPPASPLLERHFGRAHQPFGKIVYGVAGDEVTRRGRLFLVNPLDTVPLRQRLVFLDGDDEGQVAWAMGATTALNAKLILVSGSPFALMKAEQRRFYFDQKGTLTRHFGIRAVPAVVEQQGRTLAVRELVLRGTKGGRK